MTSFIQLLLVVVICILTLLLTFAAIQVFQYLKEFRQSLKPPRPSPPDPHPKPRRFFRRTFSRSPLRPP